MSDQFDKKLVNRINEVFDNFEDDSAAEGWAELRKRFPEKPERRPAIWWFSSAAAILLICGIGFFANYQTQDGVNITKRIKTTTSNNEAINSSKSTNLKANKTIEKTNTIPESLGLVKNNTSLESKHIYTYSNSHPQQKTEQLENIINEGSDNLTLIALVPHDSPNTDSALIAKVAQNETGNSITTSQNFVNTPESNRDIIEVQPPEVRANEQLSRLIKSEQRKENQKSNNNITLGFVAGSYFNYAEGSETSINSGVGVSSEIKISKKLKLSTGVSLAKNSLKYNQLIPLVAATKFSSSGNKSQFDQYYNSPALTASTISYSINSYDAEFLGLDIPVNLKYTLLERKNTVYLSTGFSSNFFINESYTYSFDYQMSGNSTLNVQNQESSSNFQSFDFARVLNFSFGFEHPLNNKNRLSFEPFVKYPLSGLGAHNLKFGAAGINLKLNFDRIK